MVALVVSRLLGAKAAGDFFLSLSVVTILATISRLGFDQILTRSVSIFSSTSEFHRARALYLHCVLRVAVVAATFSFILYIFSAYISDSIFNSEGLLSVISIFSLAILPITIYWLHSFFAQGVGDVFALNVFQNLGIGLIFICLLLIFNFFVFPLQPAGVALIYLFSAVVVFFVSAAYIFMFFKQVITAKHGAQNQNDAHQTRNKKHVWNNQDIGKKIQ